MRDFEILKLFVFVSKFASIYCPVGLVTAREGERCDDIIISSATPMFCQAEHSHVHGSVQAAGEIRKREEFVMRSFYVIHHTDHKYLHAIIQTFRKMSF